MASLGTSLGALPVLAVPRISRKLEDILQSLAAGIMLAATALSLVVPGLAAASHRFDSGVKGAFVLTSSLLVGSVGIFFIHKFSPHEHFQKGTDGPSSRRLRQTWLFVIAITLHNLPEGMAVGVGFGDGNMANGAALGTAIFLQNIPEGLIVALGMAAVGFPRWRAVLLSCATGLVETLGGLAGAAAVSVAAAFLPWAMGMAAGAMLFVISHEIIPETHRNGHEVEATFGLVVGFALMLIMNAAFA